MASLVCVLSTWMAMTASCTLRWTVFSGSSSTFFTYCWVIVDPPSRTSPASALRRRARATARRSTPLWAKKRESSMASTAAVRTGATSASGTSSRSCSACRVVISEPSEANTLVVSACAAGAAMSTR